MLCSSFSNKFCYSILRMWPASKTCVLDLQLPQRLLCTGMYQVWCGQPSATRSWKITHQNLARLFSTLSQIIISRMLLFYLWVHLCFSHNSKHKCMECSSSVPVQVFSVLYWLDEAHAQVDSSGSVHVYSTPWVLADLNLFFNILDSLRFRLNNIFGSHFFNFLENTTCFVFVFEKSVKDLILLNLHLFAERFWGLCL